MEETIQGRKLYEEIRYSKFIMREHPHITSDVFGLFFTLPTYPNQIYR